MSIYADCSKCGARFDAPAEEYKNPVCPNCKVLYGEDIPSLIKHLKSQSIPGQRHIIYLIELLYKKVQALQYEAEVSNIKAPREKKT